MTILPKKKQNKNAANEEEEHSNERYNTYGHHGSSSSSSSGQLSPSRSWSSRSEDKRTLPDSELTEHPPIGASHSKRRNRVRDRDVNLARTGKSAITPPGNSREFEVTTESDLPTASSSAAHANLNETEVRQAREGGEELASGYNSGDEYQPTPSETDWEEKERMFELMIRKKGFEIKQMGEDGACLFRAVADQVYGDQDMHGIVRRHCMDYMEKNHDYFSQYVTENFTSYIQRKRCDNIHGNHVEIQAMSELYNRPIQVFHYSNEPINIFQGCKQSDDEPIRLSYHRNTHYNSIIDPYKATIGVGLGLPSFKPGLVETSLMEKAKRISEQHVLEQAMLEDKIRATDWDATNEAIEEQIARESYLEWLRENEKRSKKKSAASSTLTNNSDEESVLMNNSVDSPPKCVSPRSSKSPRHDRASPKRSVHKKEDAKEQFCDNPMPVNSLSLAETSISQLPPSVIGLSDWGDDDDLLAQVLAQSQAEYIESLKKAKSSTNDHDQQSSSSGSNPNHDYFNPGPSTSSNYRR